MQEAPQASELHAAELLAERLDEPGVAWLTVAQHHGADTNADANPVVKLQHNPGPGRDRVDDWREHCGHRGDSGHGPGGHHTRLARCGHRHVAHQDNHEGLVRASVEGKLTGLAVYDALGEPVRDQDDRGHHAGSRASGGKRFKHWCQCPADGRQARGDRSCGSAEPAPHNLTRRSPARDQSSDPAAERRRILAGSDTLAVC